MLPWEDTKLEIADVLDLHQFRSFLTKLAEIPPAEVEAPPEQAEPQASMAEAPATPMAAAAPLPPPDPHEALLHALAGMVSHELKLQLAYLFYAETLQGLQRGELADLFRDLAEKEVADASYLMRRISVLSPGGIMIPPPASPEPISDPAAILQIMLAEEERGIAYLTAIHGMLGDDPMRFTVESMLSEEQEHHDLLMQYAGAPAAAPEVPEAAPEAEVAPEPVPKIADDASEAHEMASAASEPVTSYILRTQAATIQQHQAELEHTRNELAQARSQATAASMQAEQGQATTQQLQGELEQAQMSSQQASQMAQQATEQAAMSEESAAQQAVAKMNLSMRVQQMRQALADMASQDPVAEEGLGFGQQAGPGTPATATQQAAAQQQAAVMDPAAAGAPGAPGSAQDPNAPPQDPATAEQGEEAARAQQEAAKQTSQAQQAQEAPKPGSTVTVKTSAFTPRDPVKHKKDLLQAASILEQKMPFISEMLRGKNPLKKSTVRINDAELHSPLTGKLSSLVDPIRRAASAVGHDAGYGAIKGGVRAIKEIAGDVANQHGGKILGAGALTTAIVGGRSIGKANREERSTRALERLAGTR